MREPPGQVELQASTPPTRLEAVSQDPPARAQGGELHPLSSLSRAALGAGPAERPLSLGLLGLSPGILALGEKPASTPPTL